ncbi:MAG: tRNA pseudouridine(54/55) synthase Pus10 [Thermoplasmatales archaeon]|nr:MAG: tRNA pseudouridine(54/55) synthase Pus10 [Thermoplasmatales archaeon]
MNVYLKDKSVLSSAEKILLSYRLCDYCLGRLFAKVGKGKTNQSRGETIRENLNRSKKNDVANCWLCSGLIEEIPHFVDLILDSIKDYEFETFLIGSKVDEDVSAKEQKLIEFSCSENAELIKMELNREIGKILEKRLGKKVNFEKPTIMVIIDTAFDVVSLQISSLFIYGRYKKYSREIPQTKWFCRVCRGKGCKKCRYTGKIYETSVEELIAKKFLEKTKGDGATFHGSGREDIDVRMLGNGRPFVLEIKNPKIRNFDPHELESDINKSNKNKIEVKDLRFSDKDDVKRIKSAKFRKKYRVTFVGEKSINKEKLKKAVQSLRDKKIGQFTPSRVAHRRANLLRERYIYACDIETIANNIAILTLEVESGTYIKELISGDDGKTKPSISEIIDNPCKVTELDVIKIEGE